MSALEALGISLEEMKEVEVESRAKINAPYVTDKSVCACGHSITSHLTRGRFRHCRPMGRMKCLCKEKRAVASVSDVRYFMYSTRGSGADHALTKGVNALMMSGRNPEVKWLVAVCDKCKEEKQPLTAVAVSQRAVIVYDFPTGFDALLCVDCKKG